MRLLPSDPDIQTIVARIASGDIDLQPEFQRGEVWSKVKKQRLVDSILREWHVPPIHIIEVMPSRKQEVLDGQQRLAAIRDFVKGLFPLDGQIEPASSEIRQLDGLYYDQLPESWKRRFNQFTIRLFRIVDYGPGEPGELFFRLNQPTSLTSAEQRNAFFGPVRAQIKQLVGYLAEQEVDREFLGFTNSRMAYDDVLARVALAIERGTLSEKITASDLADLYRSEDPISDDAVTLIRAAVDKFAQAQPHLDKNRPRYNKATVFSWFLFLVRAELRQYDFFDGRIIAEYLSFFEVTRITSAIELESSTLSIAPHIQTSALLAIYESRSSARVADVSSVLLRDATIWILFENFLASTKNPKRIDLELLRRAFKAHYLPTDEEALSKALVDGGWGSLP
jgi:hypothetical protein